jgi:hypothetical protein
MAKPPLQFTRPARPQADAETGTLRPASSPVIDLESVEVQAFSLRGRVSLGSTSDDHLTESGEQRPLPLRETDAAAADPGFVNDPWRYVAVKLPAITGRKLSEIADLRCSKRTRVALEVLERPLRELARNHRSGICPPLPRVSAGTARFGVSLILPVDLAEELRYVVETRNAVKAQILVRLLVPAIDFLYIKEIRNPSQKIPM